MSTEDFNEEEFNKNIDEAFKAIALFRKIDEDENYEKTEEEKEMLERMKSEREVRWMIEDLMEDKVDTVKLIPSSHFDDLEGESYYKEHKINEFMREFKSQLRNRLIVPTELPSEMGCLSICTKCSKKIELTWNTKENTISAKPFGDTPEHCEGDYSKVEFEIKVPTGELICTDWVHGVEAIFDEHDNNNINTSFGMLQRMRAYEGDGILHVFVGNTCPSFSRKGETLFIRDCDTEDEEDLGSICTDLWWATIADRAIFKKKLLKHFDEAKAEDILEGAEYATKSVKPGVYKCTYFGRGDDSEENYIFCELKWDREIKEGE